MYKNGITFYALRWRDSYARFKRINDSIWLLNILDMLFRMIRWSKSGPGKLRQIFLSSHTTLLHFTLSLSNSQAFNLNNETDYYISPDLSHLNLLRIIWDAWNWEVISMTKYYLEEIQFCDQILTIYLEKMALRDNFSALLLNKKFFCKYSNVQTTKDLILFVNSNSMTLQSISKVWILAMRQEP